MAVLVRCLSLLVGCCERSVAATPECELNTLLVSLAPFVVCGVFVFVWWLFSLCFGVFRACFCLHVWTCGVGLGSFVGAVVSLVHGCWVRLASFSPCQN